jgi:hypothetical protein
MLPALHARWLDELVRTPIPEETEATCDHCVMCRPEETARTVGVGFFDSANKCCTYQPQLANFLVGAMLEDDSAAFAAGRASIEKRLDGRDGVTPLGLARPWAYDLLYREATRSSEAFGRTPQLRCPHYAADSGGCTIWAYREAVCSTWFCRHVRGAVGRDFWSAVKTTLRTLEDALARHCVLTVGVGAEALARLFPSEASAEPEGATPRFDEAGYAATWGDWAERERGFYRACAAVARALPWEELRRLGGAELDVRVKLLREAHEHLESQTVPRRLRRRSLHVLSSPDNRCQVTTYRIYDPIELPTPLVDALHSFDGRPTPEILEELRRDRGLVIDEQLLRRLVDFEVVGDASKG